MCDVEDDESLAPPFTAAAPIILLVLLALEANNLCDDIIDPEKFERTPARHMLRVPLLRAISTT